MNYEKHISEGWRVIDFVLELQPLFDRVMNNESYIQPFKTKEEVKKWCIENQPYYKKYIPEVVTHFYKQIQ